VPVGIIKAVEIEAGFAFPTDVTIKLEKSSMDAHDQNTKIKNRGIGLMQTSQEHMRTRFSPLSPTTACSSRQAYLTVGKKNGNISSRSLSILCPSDG
jgi:hypothetical protein